MSYVSLYSILFFFNDTATTEIYTLSLHDALPILKTCAGGALYQRNPRLAPAIAPQKTVNSAASGRCVRVDCFLRSEEHTSELQSLAYLVCRLLLEKKKKKQNITIDISRLTLYPIY